jgi:hypothetical protein
MEHKKVARREYMRDLMRKKRRLEKEHAATCPPEPAPVINDTVSMTALLEHSRRLRVSLQLVVSLGNARRERAAAFQRVLQQFRERSDEYALHRTTTPLHVTEVRCCYYACEGRTTVMRVEEAYGAWVCGACGDFFDAREQWKKILAGVMAEFRATFRLEACEGGCARSKLMRITRDMCFLCDTCENRNRPLKACKHCKTTFRAMLKSHDLCRPCFLQTVHALPRGICLV